MNISTSNTFLKIIYVDPFKKLFKGVIVEKYCKKKFLKY